MAAAAAATAATTEAARKNIVSFRAEAFTAIVYTRSAAVEKLNGLRGLTNSYFLADIGKRSILNYVIQHRDQPSANTVLQ